METRVNRVFLCKTMDAFLIEPLISAGYSLGSGYLSVILMFVCYASILLLWRYFGMNGLYAYNVLAIVTANIQVLKTTPFWLTPEPVALGTLLFATTFVVSDIITEHHGTKAARIGVALTLATQFLMTIWMVITLCYPSSSGHLTGLHSNGTTLSDPIQGAMYILFAPSLRILISSMSAFYLSQWVDISLFKWIKEKTHERFLWLRSNVSTLISGLVDNTVFSLLAWVILSPNPVMFRTLIVTYILGTYGARAVVSLTSTPLMYMSYKWKGKMEIFE